jgi:hypothetical protein
MSTRRLTLSGGAVASSSPLPSQERRPESAGAARAAYALAAALVVLGGMACTPAKDPQSDKPKPSSDATPASKLGRVKEVYQAFDFTECRPKENCARRFAERAGLNLGSEGKNPLPNPRAHLPNPDETWITAWAELPTGEPGSHYVFEALTLAAVHKTWRAACEKAHAEYDKEFTERYDKLDKAIAERNKEPNPYDRLGGLLSIEPDKPEKALLDPRKGGDFRKGSDAARYRWETALFDAFEETGRTFVYTFDAYAPSDELLAVMHPRQPKSFELEAFCLDAWRGNVPALDPPPDTSGWDTYVKKMVRPPVLDEQVRLVDKRRGELADVTRAKFAKAKLPNPQLPTGIREMTIREIKSFTRDGKKAMIRSTTTKEDRVSMPNGKTKVSKIDDNATTTFADWPSNVEVSPGDVVSFYGAELSVKEVIVRSTTELEHRSREYTIDARHITKIVSKGKTTVYFR